MNWIDLARPAAKTLFAAADVFRRSPPGPRILIYHQIGAGLGRQMEVSEADFVRQLDWMQEHGEVVDLESAIDRRRQPESNRLFVLTFDDGYRDVYERAFPLLVRRGLPFTVYLATESIETGVALTAGGLAEPLTWSQVKEMNDSGLLTIGTHTHRHVDLRKSHVTDIEEEVAISQDLVERRLHVRSLHFAYPWGYWDPVAHDVVAGIFESAVLGSGRPISSDTSPLLLNRIPVQRSDGVTFFKAKARGGMSAEDRVRRRIRGYSAY